MSTPKKKVVKKDSNSEMSDKELVNVHAELGREKHPPTKHFLQAPLVFVFLFGCLVFFCAIQLAHSTNHFRVHPPAPEISLTPEEQEAKRMKRKLAGGKKIFNSRCASCHNPDGMGKDLFPPLVGSKWVTTDPGIITKIVLRGLKGEIEVLGKKYGTVATVNMPPQPLNDREIASVVSYARKAWGHDASEVTEEQVATFRDEASGLKDQWTGAQLKDMYKDAFKGD
jgi:mono/diheme cytochrome c family protein